MNIKRLFMAAVLMAVLTLPGGCRFQPSALLPTTRETENDQLIRVEIVFTDNQRLTAYVKQLGIEDTAKVYTGGPSSTNMYDERGNITGSFNYQHVLYMRVLPEKTKD